MVAEVVATPVLERQRRGAGAGVVRGATARAAYLDLGGFVVALTAPGVPLMPNGIAVPRTDVADGAVRAGPEAIVLPGGEAVSWDGAARWDPTLRRAAPEDASALRARAAAVLDALGLVDAQAGAAPAFAAPDAAGAGGERARAGLEHLRRALADRHDGAAARAAERLLGLGGGLTPEGDDVLAATAAVAAAAGDAAGFAAPDRARWLDALVPDDVATRTTALSATLLALAREGRIVEPVHRLLDPAAGDAAWRAALATLAATGASTGRAYAAAAATALALLLGPG
jgi:hypothetical protein